MPLLFPQLRVRQVLGANTDVGKTLLTTALMRASAKKQRLFYLKPVSTGSEEEADEGYVKRNAPGVQTKCLYQYREPMSPHLAARLAPDLPFPKSNDELVGGISRYVQSCASSLKPGEQGTVWLETAGGVHSPSLHPPHTQASSLRPLLLPTVLVASPHLGGISTTLASYESLLIRGYTVSAVLCLKDDYYRNHEFLTKYFADKAIQTFAFDKPPAREEGDGALWKYYDSHEGQARGVVEHLDTLHSQRIQELESMPERTMDSVWWPFTQHGIVNKAENVMVVDSAHGDCFDAHYVAKPSTSSDTASTQTSNLNPLFDGSASWFTQSHGHANVDLTLAAASAAGRYGHVLFPSGTHAPALALAERLKETVGKGWADRVFFSDNGSTGIEVALKMALRAAGRRYGWEGVDGSEVGVIGLRGGYHGDTIGCMDACEASTFTTAVDWYRGRGHWFSPPLVQVINGKATISSTDPEPAGGHTWTETFNTLNDIYDVESRLSTPLAKMYRDHIEQTLKRLVESGRRFGALVLEPMCLGAGGMAFVDPLFQRCLVDTVRSSDLFGTPVTAEKDGWQGLPVIFDEVFSGLHRLSYLTATSILGVSPDISVYAKILTGGLLPLSCTLASRSIYNSFLSDQKVDALLHGHSYTANPIGCSVANRALELVEKRVNEGAWKQEMADWDHAPVWSLWNSGFVKDVSTRQGVVGAMAMGTVLAIELAGTRGYSGHEAQNFLDALRKVHVQPEGAESFQIHSRPLGNVVYIMTSLMTEKNAMRAMEAAILSRLEK